MRWLYYSASVTVLVFTVAACGSSGDSTPSTAGQTIVSGSVVVSGSVSAPNGQLAFLQPSYWDLFESSAYAALIGMTSVPDGTPVQLGLIDRTGTMAGPVASTHVAGGRYSFNLTNLGISFSSAYVVQVSNPATGSRLRAFVTRETVDIDPISESAVQLVADRTARMPSSRIEHFTSQELNVLRDALDALTAAQQTGVGGSINATVATIKSAAANEPPIMSFLESADAPTETTESPGDIGNFVPLDQAATWTYQGSVGEGRRGLTGLRRSWQHPSKQKGVYARTN